MNNVYLSTLIAIFQVFFNLVKYPIICLVIAIILFYLLIFVNIVIERLHGKRIDKGSHKRIKEKSFFRKIFIDLPHRIALDKFNRKADFFKYQGMIIYEGRQGEGKTIAMIHDAMQMQEEYPKAKCLSNLQYKNQDETLDDWHKLVDYKNGIYGVIAILDETQNWFGSNQSRDFPPEMLEVITQNRKNRRVILGTAQNFYLLAKAIRSQATEVRRCATFFGALTIVRRFYPVLDSEGNVKEFKKRGMYFFVHSDELRNAYDTYHVIESLSKSGFKPRSEVQENTTNNYIIMDKKCKW